MAGTARHAVEVPIMTVKWRVYSQKALGETLLAKGYGWKAIGKNLQEPALVH